MSRISNNSFKVNSALEQIVEISGGSITPSGTQNVDVVGNTIGLATASNQLTLATESTLSNVSSELATQSTDLNNISSNTSSTSSSCSNIDTNTSSTASNTSTTASNTTTLVGKITQGYDATITSGGSGLQQVVIYGRDSGGNLDACTINGSGELVVTTSGGSGTHSGSQANLMNAVSATNGTTSNVITTTSSKCANIFGSTTGTGAINVEISADNSNWYSVGYSIFADSNGQFASSFNNVVSNYWRIKATETATITATLLHA